MKTYSRKEEQALWRQAHYEAVDINDKLVINLRDLGHTIRGLYEGKGSQKRILIILVEVGGNITQQELTRRLGIQPGSASEVIAKLEGAGYIRRTPNETDRRTIDIKLTDIGREAATEARNQRIQRHTQMFSCLSDDEKETLLVLLERIHWDWEERYEKPRHSRKHIHGSEHVHLENATHQQGE